MDDRVSDADACIDEFVKDYGDKYPKAVAKLTKDRDVLLTFYDFPAALTGFTYGRLTRLSRPSRQ